MARMVTVSITYDMDDPEKSLGDELQDWLQNNINIQDMSLTLVQDKTTVTNVDGWTISIKEESPK